MNQETTWLLLQEGFNAREIAAAAGVMLPVALGMIREAIPKGATIPAMNRRPQESCETDGLKSTAGDLPTLPESLEAGSRGE